MIRLTLTEVLVSLDVTVSPNAADFSDADYEVFGAIISASLGLDKSLVRVTPKTDIPNVHRFVASGSNRSLAVAIQALPPCRSNSCSPPSGFIPTACDNGLHPPTYCGRNAEGNCIFAEVPCEGM